MSLLNRVKRLFSSDRTPKVQGTYDGYRRQRLIEGGVYAQPFWQNHTLSISKEIFENKELQNPYIE